MGEDGSVWVNRGGTYTVWVGIRVPVRRKRVKLYSWLVTCRLAAFAVISGQGNELSHQSDVK